MQSVRHEGPPVFIPGEWDCRPTFFWRQEKASPKRGSLIYCFLQYSMTSSALMSKFRSLTSMPGFVSATYYCDDEAGFAGSLTVWESKEAAEAAAATTNEKTREVMGSLYRKRPTVHVLQLYEPAG